MKIHYFLVMSLFLLSSVSGDPLDPITEISYPNGLGFWSSSITGFNLSYQFLDTEGGFRTNASLFSYDNSKDFKAGVSYIKSLATTFLPSKSHILFYALAEISGNYVEGVTPLVWSNYYDIISGSTNGAFFGNLGLGFGLDLTILGHFSFLSEITFSGSYNFLGTQLSKSLKIGPALSIGFYHRF